MGYRGVKLVLDEERLIRDDIYDLDELKEVIRKKAEELEFENISIDETKFWINDHPDALVNMGRFVYRFLFNIKAVTDYVKEFVWMTSYDPDFDLTLLLMKQGKIPKTEKYYEYIRKQNEVEEPKYDAKRGVKLVLDEEKIRREGKYDLKEIYEAIVEKAEELNFNSCGDYYWLEDSPRALADMALFVYHFLFNFKAVTDNVKEFIWLTNVDKDFDLTLLLMKQGKIPKTEKYYEYENRIKKEIENDPLFQNKRGKKRK
ncbi:hypothetical protein [Campylobacter sp. RM16189]|uniref:hypothetical protein n=1 Tax=Campylobacter sp. RM16189 TaxID=1705726 RepID=UPI0014739989|nr:hypothetical protein [Campylobacter sp. RM16189]